MEKKPRRKRNVCMKKDDNDYDDNSDNDSDDDRGSDNDDCNDRRRIQGSQMGQPVGLTRPGACN